MIDINLLKQVTELGDWIFSLPTRIVEAVMAPREAYLRGKNKNNRLEELRALSEVGEHLTQIYLFKGNIYRWVNRLQAQQEVEEVQHVRGLFEDAAYQLGEVEEILKGARLSSIQLAIEAGAIVGDAKQTYETLAKLPDATILEDRSLIDLIAEMDRLSEAGKLLARMADSHRKELDGIK